MNICFIVNQADICGGRQKTANKVIDYLKEKDYNIFIMNENIYDKITDYNIFSIIKFLKTNKIDLVILISSFSILNIWKYVYRIYNIPIIYSEHCSPEYTLKRWNYTERNDILKISKKIRIHFDSYKEYFKPFSDKCYVIPNSKKLKNISLFKNNNTVIYSGRLVEDPKNIIWLLENFNKIENNNIILKVYGEDFIGINNYITKNIKYMGVSNNIEEIYKNSCLLLSTSDSEGFGNSILESLSYSIPVLALDDYKFGVSKLIQNDVNGYKTSKDNFIPLLIKLINDKQKLNELSNNCFNSINEYDDNIQLVKWEKMINECF